MTEDEARGLEAAIAAMASQPSTDEWVLQARRSTEGYFAEAKPDGSWRVVVLWSVLPYRYGVRINELYDIAGYEEATLDEAAVALWGLVEEPHGDSGQADEQGRAWLGA